MSGLEDKIRQRAYELWEQSGKTGWPSDALCEVRPRPGRIRRAVSLSAYAFCHGERGDVGRSRMPIDRSLRIKTSP
jgi:hypothetical protein